jgi:Multicopper oxidase
MTTSQLIIADHVVALLGAVAWSAAGAAAATRRGRLALGLLAAAVLVTLARVATVAVLAGRGWWFVQEKVLLDLPMRGAVGLAAVLVTGPRLLAAWRTPAAGIPASSVVLLLTAGYAAVAGLVVTLVVGYPVSWSTALIATSVVGAGALLTGRIVAAPADTTGDDDIAPAPAASRTRRFSRRRFIGLTGGAIVASTGATGVRLVFVPAESVATGGGHGPLPRPGPPVSVADPRGAGAPAPGGRRRQYTLTARTATVRPPSAGEIQAWTYNGRVPGPPITATAGDLIEVTLRNTDIDDGVTVHWHGYDVACGEDGAPA